MTRAVPILLFLGFWLLLLGGGRSSFLRDPGTFWHTTTGEIILRDGFVAHDPYTFTFAGTPWVPYQWLGEVAFALIHRVAGLDGLLAVTTAALAALFAWLTTRLLRTGLHPVAVLGLAGLALAASASHFHIRPHVATMALLALVVAALQHVEANRLPVRSLWWLVPLFVVWTNTHGGMLGGLATLGGAGVAWVAWRLLGRPSPVTSLKDAAWLAVIGLACGATAVANPYGFDLPRTWLDIMSMPQLPNIIKEHSRTDFLEPTTWPLVALSVVYLFALAGTKPRDWCVSWLLPLMWLVQAYVRVRHAPLFAVTACVALADLWPATRWATWLAERRPDFYNPAGLPVQWTPVTSLSAALCLCVALLLQTARVEVPLIGYGWANLDPKHWPTELTTTLRSFEPQSPTANRIFNDYIDGGFVIYHAPGYKVFVDDRCEVFGGEWLTRLVESGHGDPSPAMTAWEAEYGPFDFALTRTGTPFDGYFRTRPETWYPEQTTPTATFYRRKGSQQRDE